MENIMSINEFFYHKSEKDKTKEEIASFYPVYNSTIADPESNIDDFDEVCLELTEYIKDKTIPSINRSVNNWKDYIPSLKKSIIDIKNKIMMILKDKKYGTRCKSCGKISLNLDNISHSLDTYEI